MSLSRRLTLSILSLCVLCTAVIWLSTHLFFQAYFVDYINQQELVRMRASAERFAIHYARYKTWSQLLELPSTWLELTSPQQRSSSTRPPPVNNRPEQRSGIRRMALIAESGNFLVGDRSIFNEEKQLSVPITVEGEIVGYLVTAEHVEATEGLDQNFAKSLNNSILVTLAIIITLSFLVSAYLGKNLTKPIKRLSRATTSLANGQYEEHIKIDRDDEIGKLTADFNTLANTLEQSKKSQQRWIADISHELRTPLAILKGELMAIEDGIRQFDQESLSSLIAETDKFNRMVNDLYDLSRADSGDLDYRMEPIDISIIVHDCLFHMTNRFKDKKVELIVNCKETELIVMGDQGRMTQLFSNLFENSLRYTDMNGQCILGCSVRDRFIDITLEDSPPGVPSSDHAKIFDRLYRVENSRSREFGGGGLGLALCKAIVKAHDGYIKAENSSLLGGLKITISLPYKQS